MAASSGEWLIYLPIEAKQITCTIIGVILNIIYSTGLETLAVMSIERFLFVSKPHIHKNKFTNKVCLFASVYIGTCNNIITEMCGKT